MKRHSFCRSNPLSLSSIFSVIIDKPSIHRLLLIDRPPSFSSSGSNISVLKYLMIMDDCSWETSLERSFRSISIDDEESSTELSPENQSLPSSRLINPEELSPPLQNWDRYLDLQTGEVYYVHWHSGRRLKKVTGHAVSALQICKEEEEDHCNSQDYSEEEDDLHTNSIGEASPTESDVASCSMPEGCLKEESGVEGDDVLVVAGCRSCLTYFMLPKTAGGCPKCKDSLLHLNNF